MPESSPASSLFDLRWKDFASTGDEAHLTRAWEMERDFLASHVIPWISLLRDKVCEKTQHPYFRIMAELATEVTQNDLTALEDLLGPSPGHAVPNYNCVDG